MRRHPRFIVVLPFVHNAIRVSITGSRATTVIDEKEKEKKRGERATFLPCAHRARITKAHTTFTRQFRSDRRSCRQDGRIDRIPPVPPVPLITLCIYSVPGSRKGREKRRAAGNKSRLMIASGDRLEDNFFPHAGRQQLARKREEKIERKKRRRNANAMIGRRLRVSGELSPTQAFAVRIIRVADACQACSFSLSLSASLSLYYLVIR